MSLEQRLRNELDRTAPRAVRPAPSIDEIEKTVGKRRKHNSLTVRAAAAVLVVGAIGAGVLIARPDSGTEVVATAPDDAGEVEAQSTDPAVGTKTEEVAAEAVSPADVGTETRDPEIVGPQAPLVVAPAEGSIDTVQLQADDATLAVDSRASAVDFAGGSGVLLVSEGSGYAGLASRFGGSSGVTAIGLTSADGLDWNEVELTGVPAGATATVLRNSGDGYVALFSSFDVEAQKNNSFVGTSVNLVDWTLSSAIPGASTQVADVAVGGGGVIVTGVAPKPRVWTGPLGGPYELSGAISGAQSLAGIVAIDAGFVAVGVSVEGGPALFDSVDGSTWVTTPMSGIGSDDNVVNLSVMNGSIVLAGHGDDMTWTALSSDGGQSWQRTDFDQGSVGSVATTRSTVSFLGTSPLGTTTVTLSNGESWSSADLELAAPDRVQLLVAGDDEAVLLATIDGTLTWVVASR